MQQATPSSPIPLITKLSRLLFPIARGRSYQPAPKRVLLASADESLRAELVSALEHDGHHVVEVDDGLELLDYLAASRVYPAARLPPPHVIIASLSMAGMSGVALLEVLRHRGDPTPFIGLAESADAPLFARVNELKAAFIFEAPVRLDDVRAALFSLPGGAFAEGTVSHDARLEACERGTHFMRPGSES